MEPQFFLPAKYVPEPERRGAWASIATGPLLGSGKAASAQAWIYQTYSLFQEAGAACKLVHELPERGLVIALNGCLPDDFRPGPELFVVGVVADFLPHPGAHIQVVQNRALANRLAEGRFMPHWPQPGLIPRDPARGDRFETVSFFGDPSNLAPELRGADFADRLRRELGLEFTVCGADRWHDYSATDCAIAIRDFRGGTHLIKPATKLYNAWLAGVPFIGGTDSAFRSEREGADDYLECRSVDGLMAHLRRLKEDAGLRAEMRAAAAKRREGFTREAIVGRWRDLLSRDAPAAAAKWFARPIALRNLEMARRRAAYAVAEKIGRFTR